MTAQASLWLRHTVTQVIAMAGRFGITCVIAVLATHDRLRRTLGLVFALNPGTFPISRTWAHKFLVKALGLVRML
jgi:hypothetical protein